MSEPDESERIGYWQGLLYAMTAGTRTLAVMSVAALLVTPLTFAFTALKRGTGTAGVLAVIGLALLGACLPLVSVFLARADWQSAATLLHQRTAGQPEAQLREPRTLVRPLAYTIVMVTLGGAVTILAVLLTLGSAVALISPLLTMTGDQAVIGPFDIRTVSQSLLAAVVGLILVTAIVRISPLIARMHAVLVLQVLTRPEQRLERDLTVTVESRARVVRAFDIERRRIERNLHDGVQPELLAVSMTLGLALDAMPLDAPGRDDVVRAQKLARQTLDVLRRLVRGIHPQVLVDHGLGAAVREVTDLLTLPIDVNNQLEERLPTDIETNLYFCISELLTNVVKHTNASCASVHLEQSAPGQVTVRVRDDGRGGAGTGGQAGSGLDGIADRIAALNGQLWIDSPLGGPTLVTMTVPIDRRSA